MSNTILALFSALPIVLALVLMVFLRQPATRAMPLAWLVCALVGLTVWRMPAGFLLASTLAGFGSALNLLIIIYGAIVVLYTLRESGGLDSINAGLQSLSGDRRIQVLIISFMFSAFLEGASGFGTPGLITSLLLLSLGFPALASVMVCLIFSSFPVTFGVVGTVVWFGLKNLKPLVEKSIAIDPSILNVTDIERFYQVVGHWAAGINTLVIFVLPMFAVCFLTRYFGEKRSWKEGLGVWKFSLFASCAFLVPYVGTAMFLGVEFPSLLGGLVGLGAVILALKKGWFRPKREWDFPPRATWSKDWMGTIRPGDKPATGRSMSQLRAWSPYILICIILVLTRMNFLPFKAWCMDVIIAWNNMLGYESVDFSMTPFYLPGVIPFMPVALITIFIHRMGFRQVSIAWLDGLARLKRPALALIFSVALVEIFKQSAVNGHGYPAMPLTMATAMSEMAGHAWPLFSPFLGALGAFIAGSATVSNLLFSEIQFGVAMRLSLPIPIVVALQVVGGSMGTMLSVHNVVAASAAVGLHASEGAVIRRNALPMFIYGVIAGVLGLLFIHVFS